MRSQGANGVGRFSVDIEVANNDDLALVRRGLLPPDQVRRETIPGVVDSGAAMLMLPQAVVKRLGLPLGNSSGRLSSKPSICSWTARPSRSCPAIRPARSTRSSEPTPTSADLDDHLLPAPGAQTERRGDAGPVRGLLGGRTSPAVLLVVRSRSPLARSCCSFQSNHISFG